MWPVFGFCKGFVVVLRGGCMLIRGLRLRVFDLDCKKRWYLATIKGLGEVIKGAKMRESQTFDYETI